MPASPAASSTAAAGGDGASWSAFPGDGLVPVNGRHVHDPTLVHVGGRYFCFCTSGRGFGALRSSVDLHHWDLHGPVMDTPPWLCERIPHHRSMWAPDVIHTDGGGLRMYYCASERFGWNTSYIGLAECKPFDPARPNEGWRDLGLIIESQRGRDHFNAIDPEVRADEESGRLWMFFGSYFSGIYVIELDPDTGKLRRPEKPDLILVARRPEDRENGLEGAAVVRRGAYYYLFLSYGLAGQGVRSTYQIGVGRSNSITGPYVDAAGTTMINGGRTALLKSSSPMFAPGHCDVMQDEADRWLMSHHYYDGRKFWTGDKWGMPTLQVRELLWTDDGWPLPGMPAQLVAEPKSIAGAEDVIGAWVHQVDFGEPAVLQLRADGSATLDDEPGGSWSLADRRLTLRWPRSGAGAADGGMSSVRLQFATDGRYYVGRNDAGAVVRGARVETGER